MIARIDRYVFREILGPTLLSLTLYIFLLLMNVLFDVAREAIENQVPMGILARLLYYQLPNLLVVSLPMAVLLGTLIGVGRLSTDSEIVALQAAGVPFRRLFRPVLALGIFISLVCFYFVAVVAPHGTYLHHLVRREVYLSRYANAEKIVPRVFHQNLPGLLLYYDSRDPSSGMLNRVFLFEEDTSASQERVTVARRGQLGFDHETGRVTLLLHEGTTHVRRLGADPEEGYSVISFETFQESRAAPGYIQALSTDMRPNHREMSMAELAREITRARGESNPAVRRLRMGLARTNWHERLALPAATLVFALLGLPLGLVNRRGGKSSGFALSLGVVLVYWVGYSVLRDLAETGRMDAMLALWIPNLTFALLAAGLAAARLRPPGSGRRVRWLTALSGWRRRRRVHLMAGTGPAPRFPLLIDRYVAGKFLRVLFFVMLSVYMVYLLVEFRSLIDDMVDHDVSGGLVLQYLVFLVPRMTITVLPVACLVATLVGLGLMARTREDTAVKAAGVSVYRLLLPVLLVTLALCLGGFLVQDEVLPTSNRVAEELRDRIGGRTPRTRDPRRRWVVGADGRFYRYETASFDGLRLQGLSVFDVEPDGTGLRSRAYATRAGHDGRVWQLGQGWQRQFKGELSEVDRWQTAAMELGITPAFLGSEDTILYWGVQREPDQMSYADHRAYIRQLEKRGYDVTALQVDLARKISFPLIPLFMVMVGFPFSLRFGPRGSLFGIGLAIGLTVVYWAALAVFNALGTTAVLSPLLAAWAPNIFFGGVGLYLSLHVRT